MYKAQAMGICIMFCGIMIAVISLHNRNVPFFVGAGAATLFIGAALLIGTSR